MQTVNLKSKEISQLPTLPGVYLMKNNQGKILYVGKAKVLRSRVKSYFSSSDSSLKNRFLIRQMKKVDYIVTANEEEACLLEASLIKKYKPRYNVRLKDDKAYPYIRCSVQDDFPRLYFERKVTNRKSLYFGPYTQSGAVRAIMNFLNHTFQLRDCSDSNFKTRERPCLTHQMGFCTAPCVELTDKKEYRKQFQRAVQFLKGRHIGLVKNLKYQMKQRAEELRFEEAARLRESLKAVEMIEQNQLVIRQSETDQDVVCALSDECGFLVEFLYLRKGRLIGIHHRFFKTSFDEETFFSFLNQYYGEHLIPDEILIDPPLKKSRLKLLERVLTLRKGDPCHVNKPEEEKDKALMDRARQNAENHLKDKIRQEKSQREILEEIQKKFHLPTLPLRMECYDISHWQGKGTVGSQAVFENGQPKKEDYRLYGLKKAAPSDDYGSLKEVLTRRLLHTEYEDPHLLIIDGGKGQLRAAQKVLKDIGRQDIPIVSLAKDRLLHPTKNSEIDLTEIHTGNRPEKETLSEQKSNQEDNSSPTRNTHEKSNQEDNLSPTGNTHEKSNQEDNLSPTGNTHEKSNQEDNSSPIRNTHEKSDQKQGTHHTKSSKNKKEDIQKLSSLSSGERFYLPGRKNPVLFKPSPAFHLLLHIRDEAHRFALETHRKKRDKLFLSGNLDQIPGLGPKRKQNLLKKFGSPENIKQASEKELASTPSISPTLAHEIKNSLNLKS
ncbi:MAG: excinuclease ABC subunit UvrC [Bdellovibrionales bacterium]|nr:excinuclease ABC subunit UvrC [Bdellovibrionales bacterium]